MMMESQPHRAGHRETAKGQRQRYRHIVWGAMAAASVLLKVALLVSERHASAALRTAEAIYRSSRRETGRQEDTTEGRGGLTLLPPAPVYASGQHNGPFCQ